MFEANRSYRGPRLSYDLGDFLYECTVGQGITRRLSFDDSADPPFDNVDSPSDLPG